MKNNLNQNNAKLTGFDWNSNIFKLNFQTFSGFPSKEFFYNIKISRQDFINYAANCQINHDKTLTRRGAQKFKQELQFKHDDSRKINV